MEYTYTAKLIHDIGKQVEDAKTETVFSMATGSVGTIDYMGQLYEVRVTPIEYGIEKWSHPTKPLFEDGKVSECCGAPDTSNGDMSLSDIGICSDCKEHTEYVEAA